MGAVVNRGDHEGRSAKCFMHVYVTKFVQHIK